MLRGATARQIVAGHVTSLEVPTATSVRRSRPSDRQPDVINNQLKRTRGGKISFTHLLGAAPGAPSVKGPSEPALRRGRRQGHAVTPARTNLGLAIDLQGKDGAFPGGRHQAVRDHAIRAAATSIVRRAATAS